MAKLGILYTDPDGFAHTCMFRMREYEWGIAVVESEPQQAARFAQWADAFASILADDSHITGIRYLNNDNSLSREYLTPTPVAGEHQAVIPSRSATVGFTVKSAAPLLTGRRPFQVSRFALGHADWFAVGHTQVDNAVMVNFQQVLNFLTGFPHAMSNGSNGYLMQYVSVQYNAFLQRKRGC